MGMLHPSSGRHGFEDLEHHGEKKVHQMYTGLDETLKARGQALSKVTACRDKAVEDNLQRDLWAKAEAIPVDVLKAMVLTENQLRLSNAWQERFAAAEKCPGSSWTEAADALQHHVAKEHGLGEEGVLALRSARSLHPEEPFFQEVPLYVKYNRSRNGELGPGAAVPHLEVLNLQCKPVCPWKGLSKPLVLIGGSHS